jgi:hypothetical protein
MVKRFFAAVLAAGLVVPVSASAQDVQVDEVKDVKRHLVIFYKFGPEGRSALKDMLWGTFLPAMREAGVPVPTILHPDDGEWDMVMIQTLPGGYTDLHFNTSPSDAKWHSIAIRKVGKEAWDSMWDKWSKAIVRQQSFIAHEH